MYLKNNQKSANVRVIIEDEEYIVRLIGKVVTVSVETVKIILKLEDLIL